MQAGVCKYRQGVLRVAREIDGFDRRWPHLVSLLLIKQVACVTWRLENESFSWPRKCEMMAAKLPRVVSVVAKKYSISYHYLYHIFVIKTHDLWLCLKFKKRDTFCLLKPRKCIYLFCFLTKLKWKILIIMIISWTLYVSCLSSRHSNFVSFLLFNRKSVVSF